MTALLSAAEEGHLDVMALLLDRGANIEAAENVKYESIWTFLISNILFPFFIVSKDGCTALIETAGRLDGPDHRDVVALLLKRGANIEAASNVINDKVFSICYLSSYSPSGRKDGPYGGSH